MWSATKARIQPWLTKHQQTLQHRPAAQMFPLGLTLGGGVAAMALLGLGQLLGLLVCALLLGATISLLRGAEPVTRQLPAPPVRTRRDGPLPEVSPMPSPGTAPYMVADIPELLESTGAVWGMFLKRAFDVIVASLLVLLMAPLFLLLALLIKIFSPQGPVFFVQTRVGYNRRQFKMLKFRTMVPDTERLHPSLEHLNEAQGPVFKIKNDPRITPIGHILRKTSLDELPQLFNVIKGDMSLVGPRPLPLRDVGRFEEAWLKRRFSVKPGITCLWQVSERSNATFDTWIAQDLAYIDNWSFHLDLKILWASIIASAIPSTTVPGKSTAAPEEKGVTGLHRKRNGPAQSVSRYDFFIAYASPNRQQAQNLSWFLQDESCAVFLDVECLAPGASWPHALREAVEASRVIVVLVSAHTDHAFYQQEEIVLAMQLARDKPGVYAVIPVILDKLPQGAVSMPYGMSSLQAPDANRPGGLKRVAAELAVWLDAH